MHSFLDKYTVAMTSLLLGNSKWFRESLDSALFDEQLKSIKLSLPEIDGEGFYELEAETAAGVLDPAFHVAKWLGPEQPTIIYHHGNNERPFNYGVASKNTFKPIFLSKKEMFQANLISLRAPFHNNNIKYYLNKMGRLANFSAMLSVSVKLTEALVDYLHKKYGSHVMVCGVSLGGWVTNLHRAFYNSADSYVPVFAGAALDQLFLTSYYRRLTSKLALDNPDAVRKVLNFEAEFVKQKGDNVYPLLALHDQYIEYEWQKHCYKDTEVRVINKGHITGTLASELIRDHVQFHLKR